MAHGVSHLKTRAGAEVAEVRLELIAYRMKVGCADRLVVVTLDLAEGLRSWVEGNP